MCVPNSWETREYLKKNIWSSGIYRSSQWDSIKWPEPWVQVSK